MRINKNVLDLCKEKKIKPDQMGSILFVMNCMYDEEFDLLDKFDDSNSNKNALIIYKEAEKISLLKRDKDNEKKVHFILTYEGKRFWEEVLEASDTSEYIPRKIERMSDWITDWTNLWKDEKGIYLKDTTQRPSRSLGINERDAFEQMNAFLLRYGYLFRGKNVKEIIMGATLSYINLFRKDRFKYCRNAYYFIMREENKIIRSTLAECCENFINGSEIPSTEKTSFGYATNNEEK